LGFFLIPFLDSVEKKKIPPKLGEDSCILATQHLIHLFLFKGADKPSSELIVIRTKHENGWPPQKKQQLYYIEGFTMLSPPKPFSRNKNILRCPWVFSPRPVISPVKRSSYKPTYYPETPGVWYICLHLPKPNVGKYTSPIGLYGP